MILKMVFQLPNKKEKKKQKSRKAEKGDFHERKKIENNNSSLFLPTAISPSPPPHLPFPPLLPPPPRPNVCFLCLFPFPFGPLRLWSPFPFGPPPHSYQTPKQKKKRYHTYCRIDRYHDSTIQIVCTLYRNITITMPIPEGKWEKINK